MLAFRRFFYRFFITFVFFFFTTLSPLLVFANTEDFSVQTKTSAAVSSKGLTTITQDFTITNLTAGKYLTNYVIQVSTPHLQNIKASSASEEITVQNAVKDDQTIITINFQDEIVGEDKKHQFRLTYDSTEFAQVLGDQVLEVNLPQLAADIDNSAQLLLSTPKQFGLPVRVIPSSATATESGDQILTTFPLNDNTLDHPFRASFGGRQFYKLENQLIIDNPNQTNLHYQVALIPDTPHQKITYLQLNPQPQKIIQDEDLNWLATYILKPQEKVTVTIEALAELTLQSNPEIPTTILNDQNQALYLTPQKYWESDHPEIKNITDSCSGARSINDYIVKNFAYDLNKAANPADWSRDGAVKALQNKQGVCTEFTDAYIALARAQGIPARARVGYAASNNDAATQKIIFHIWPEYYDGQTQTWHQIDPTWENTAHQDYFNNFDLAHVTLAINGLNSQLPNPLPSDTMQVSFATNDEAEKLIASASAVQNQPHVYLSKHSNFFLNLFGFRQLHLVNPSGQALYQIQLTAANNDPYNSQGLVFDLENGDSSDYNFVVLLPFSEQSVTIRPTNLVDFPLTEIRPQLHYQLQITQANDLILEQPLTIGFQLSPTLVVVAGGLLTAALITGSLLVFRRR